MRVARIPAEASTAKSLQPCFRTAVLLLLLACQSFAIAAVDTKQLIVQDFGDVQPQPRTWTDKLGRHIEVCGGDWCQLVSQPAKPRVKDQSAWDAAFLMIFFFASSDDYRARRKESAMQLLGQYSASCPKQVRELETARCVLRGLSSSRDLKYFHTTYDEGARCVGRFSVDPPHFSQRLVCTSAPVRELDPADWARAHPRPNAAPAATR